MLPWPLEMTSDGVIETVVLGLSAKDIKDQSLDSCEYETVWIIVTLVQCDYCDSRTAWIIVTLEQRGLL